MSVHRKHRAVATMAIHAPLGIIEVETEPPAEGEVLVKVEWTGSTPLDMHQNDGGIFVKHPQVLGDSLAGTVVELGAGVKSLKVGDKVFGFGWRSRKEHTYQEYATMSEYILGKIPANITPQAAATVPTNLVTVFHTVTRDLELDLPWPLPQNYTPAHADEPLLIWGGSSSVGMFALQVLRYYGYKNTFAVASKTHHGYLKSLGAARTFDYRDKDVADQILRAAASVSAKKGEPTIPHILDCIGSKDGSLASLARIAQKGAKVAVLLPIIVKDSSDTENPVYSFEAEEQAEWANGAIVKGVRTHFYLENEFLKTHMQPVIMPALLEAGIIEPPKQRIIEGKTLLERAQTAIDLLRRKQVSGERLVWRISDNSA